MNNFCCSQHVLNFNPLIFFTQDIIFFLSLSERNSIEYRMIMVVDFSNFWIKFVVVGVLLFGLILLSWIIWIIIFRLYYKEFFQRSSHTKSYFSLTNLLLNQSFLILLCLLFTIFFQKLENQRNLLVRKLKFEPFCFFEKHS